MSDEKADDGDAGGDGATGPPPVAALDRSERVELGVDLLAAVGADELDLAEAVDRVETVTTDPSITRDILDAAERRGVIERDGGRVRTRRGGSLARDETRVVRREGQFRCRRCGAGLSAGHFIRFESGELGPFGPECVRRVAGRD